MYQQYNVTENKETIVLSLHLNLVPLSLSILNILSMSLSILNISNCQPVLEYLSLHHKLFKFS